MIKTGEVKVDSTPCDICSEPATVIVGNTAKCAEHATDNKESSVDINLKSFTEPLEEVV